MSDTANKKYNWEVLKRLFALAKPYQKVLFTALTLAVIIAPVTTARPYLIKVMVDDYIRINDIEGLTFVAFLVFAALVLQAVLQYSFLYTTRLLGQLMVKYLRVEVFHKVLGLQPAFFDKTPIGTTTTRTINDIQSINRVFTQGVISIVADVLALIVTLLVMFYTSWKLTIICLTTIPFLLLATYIFKEKVKASYERVRNEISNMNAFLQERISGMRIVQIFNAEKTEHQNFKTINKSYTQAYLDSILYYAVFFPVVELISAVSLALMVWWGARNVVIDAGVTLGALIAFPVYLNMLFRPMRMLADKFNELQMGLIAAERVFNIIDLDEKIDNNGVQTPQHLKGDVVFNAVSFAYNEPEWVLKKLDFTIKEGETLAIIGSTGSGKTTIISLLNRFYDVQKGSIEIGGQDIRHIELHALRRRIAIVLQDVFLFSGSVLDNIRLRDESITRDMIINAAKLIGAHDFIQKLPGGYDYEVMERGAALSMGQRQLISFVRALVFDPDILILDEATSSIDPETEAVIQYAIEKLIAKRTSIIIAHRLSTIRHADNILVLDKGEKKEFGSHQELITNEEGAYRHLYDMQFV